MATTPTLEEQIKNKKVELSIAELYADNSIPKLKEELAELEKYALENATSENATGTGTS